MELKTIASTVLVVLASSAAHAEPGYGRGAILNTDWQKMEIQIKDEKDREAIWKVARDAKVKFTDKAWENRTPRLQDLRAGMYVHFTFDGNTSVIQEIDVKDVGASDRGGPGSTAPTSGATGSTVTGRVTAVDLKVAQVEVMAEGAGRKTYQAANARVLERVRAGDWVTLVTEDRNGQPVVVDAKVTTAPRPR
jgi:hypothetical protein